MGGCQSCFNNQNNTDEVPKNIVSTQPGEKSFKKEKEEEIQMKEGDGLKKEEDGCGINGDKKNKKSEKKMIVEVGEEKEDEEKERNNGMNRKDEEKKEEETKTIEEGEMKEKQAESDTKEQEERKGGGKDDVDDDKPKEKKEQETSDVKKEEKNEQIVQSEKNKKNREKEEEKPENDRENKSETCDVKEGETKKQVKLLDNNEKDEEKKPKKEPTGIREKFVIPEIVSGSTSKYSKIVGPLRLILILIVTSILMAILEKNASFLIHQLPLIQCLIHVFVQMALWASILVNMEMYRRGWMSNWSESGQASNEIPKYEIEWIPSVNFMLLSFLESMIFERFGIKLIAGEDDDKKKGTKDKKKSKQMEFKTMGDKRREELKKRAENGHFSKVIFVESMIEEILPFVSTEMSLEHEMEARLWDKAKEFQNEEWANFAQKSVEEFINGVMSLIETGSNEPDVEENRKIGGNALLTSIEQFMISIGLKESPSFRNQKSSVVRTLRTENIEILTKDLLRHLELFLKLRNVRGQME